MRRFRFVLPVIVVLSGLIVPASLAGTSPAAAAGSPCGTMTLGSVNYQHVIWIWMENHNYGDIINDTTDAPYINTLAGECGLATDYTNITHFSLPNYIGATSGLSLSALKPFYGDCNVSGKCSTKVASIFSQGETWKAYEESMPVVCDKANFELSYAVRHNPPVYFKKLKFCKPKKAVRHGPKVSYDVSYGQLATDLAANTLPAFSFVTPNLTDDMHNGTITDGDNWLAFNLPTILNSTQYQAGHVAVFITWDEGGGPHAADTPGFNCVNNPVDAQGCHVPMIVVSPSTSNTPSGTLFSHYSLLRTTEDLLHLGHLGQAASAASMASAFNL